MDIVFVSLLVSLGINITMFVPAFIFKTDKITDISYAVTFAVVSSFAFAKSSQDPLHTAVFGMVLLWSFRLGSFLFMRIQKMGKDKRFDDKRDRFFAFLGFWLLQGATVFVVMLAPLFAFKQQTTTFTVFSIVGIVLFFIGLILEATADAQKFAFNNEPTNKDKWIDEGVWRLSRHPNYLGEMLVWIGMYLAVVSSLQGVDVFWALLSPLYIVLLLLFVSGIPLLEKAANKKWGTSSAYIQYKKEVPVLLPTISSVKRYGQRLPSKKGKTV